MHIKGKDNVVAEALSRINEITMPTVLSPEIIENAQNEDEELQQNNESFLQLQRLKVDDTIIYCDISANIVRPFIPMSLRKSAFNTVHVLSHPSIRSTSKLMHEKYIWYGITKECLRWSRDCLDCQRAKIQRYNRLKPNYIEVPDNRFSHIHIALIKLPKVNNLRYCLTIVDRFSRWPEAIPLPDITADTVASALYRNWICRYGSPLTITSDQGTQFESALFTALANLVSAHRTRTTPYHPASNGLVERMHRTLKAALMCASHIPWPELLPTVLLGLRTSFKEDLNATPADLVYGTSLRVPGEFFVIQEVPANPQIFLVKFRKHMRGLRPTPTAHHIKQRIFILKDLLTCTHIWIRCDGVRRTFEPPYPSPYEVIERTNDKYYKINIDGEEKNISIEWLKPAYITIVDDETTPETPVDPMQQHYW